MKRFLTLILFSILIPIQNSSAVSPSLDETIEFLVNGDSRTTKWSIDECVLTTYFKHNSGEFREYTITDLNKVKLNSIVEAKPISGWEAVCDGNCHQYITGDGWKTHGIWYTGNGISWKRNKKALDHLYSNFCTGIKSAF